MTDIPVAKSLVAAWRIRLRFAVRIVVANAPSYGGYSRPYCWSLRDETFCACRNSQQTAVSDPLPGSADCHYAQTLRDEGMLPVAATSFRVSLLILTAAVVALGKTCFAKSSAEDSPGTRFL